MPIISLVTSLSNLTTQTIQKPTCQANVQLTPGPPPNSTPIKSDFQWSHSGVFVTPYGTSLAIGSGRVADLTSVFTPSPSCVDRWLLAPTPSCGIDDTAIGLDTVWSVNPTRSIVSDVAYSNCQLYGTATYSPGICWLLLVLPLHPLVVCSSIPLFQYLTYMCTIFKYFT